MIRIGPYRLSNRLALAPMAGVTDLPFRRLCRELGAGYVVGEMISANPRLRDTRKSLLRSNHRDEPHPVAVQIAGGDPAWMAEAARCNVSRGAQIIDINMGCPARKVCNRLAGSALLDNEALVEDILKAVVAAVNVPVTLKMRTGPEPTHRNGVRIALIAEDCGIQALAVHGRTRADRFLGEAEYDTIRAIRARVSIPVFANGDVKNPRDAVRVLEYTGADGLMLGRAAQGNPWIFGDILHFMDHGEERPPVAAREVGRVMVEHLRQLHAFYGYRQGVRIARKHIGWYLQGRADGEPLRRTLMRVENAAEQTRLVSEFFEPRWTQAA